MPNQNTIGFRFTGAPSPAQGANAIPAVVPTGTSAFIVTNQLGNAAFGVVGNAASQPTGAQTYGSGFDGFVFKVRVVWKVTTKAACNVTVAIVQANSATTTYTAGNVVATTGATSNGTGSFNGWLEYWAVWDSTSQALSGAYTGYKGASTPAVIAYTTQTNNLTVTSQASLGFQIAATFSDTTTGTTMTITEFCAEAV